MINFLIINRILPFIIGKLKNFEKVSNNIVPLPQNGSQILTEFLIKYILAIINYINFTLSNKSISIKQADIIDS